MHAPNKALKLCTIFRRCAPGSITCLCKGGAPMLDAYIVGQVIQRFREDRKLSQELVSGLAGIGRTHLSAIERGERKPTLETLYKIGYALGVKPSVIMAEIEKEIEKR